VSIKFAGPYTAVRQVSAADLKTGETGFAQRVGEPWQPVIIVSRQAVILTTGELLCSPHGLFCFTNADFQLSVKVEGDKHA
jgi:hypothetical protein